MVWESFHSLVLTGKSVTDSGAEDEGLKIVLDWCYRVNQTWIKRKNIVSSSEWHWWVWRVSKRLESSKGHNLMQMERLTVCYLSSCGQMDFQVYWTGGNHDEERTPGSSFCPVSLHGLFFPLKSKAHLLIWENFFSDPSWRVWYMDYLKWHLKVLYERPINYDSVWLGPYLYHQNHSSG